MDRVILHSDLNNFYASVECLYNPSLRHKPVAVAGDPQARHGIVLAKNEAAKACGVTTGNPLWLARQKCPELVFVSPHYELYLQYSRLTREIYREYTDQVESYGLDECWLDVTGSASLFGAGAAIANQLRRRIYHELGVTVSVGVSFNKIFAKLGSDLRKPNATTSIPRDHFQELIWPLSIRQLLFIGPATLRRLHLYGIDTIGALANTKPSFLQTVFGKNGRMLWRFANGLDVSPVSSADAPPLIKSIGNSTTTPRDLVTDDDVRIILYALCESVASRLRDQHFVCGAVQISIRDHQLQSFERQSRLSVPVCDSRSLFEKAYWLYRRSARPGLRIRSLGVRACQLSSPAYSQLSYLPEISDILRREALDRTVDSIRNRFGHFAVQRGLFLTDPSLSRINPKEEHIIHPEIFTAR